jgi:surfeit locus 1 family protein
LNSNKYQFNFKIVPTAIFLILFLGFIRLGFWQIDRADQKEILNDAYSSRQSDAHINLNNIDDLNNDSRLLWKKVELKGMFKNEQNIILDNQIHNGVAGFNIITPFKIEGIEWVVLVNRGWHKNLNLRSLIPDIKPIRNKIQIKGNIVKFPVSGISLGEKKLEVINSEINRVQRIDIQNLNNFYSSKFLPYMVYLEPLLDRDYESSFKLPAPGSDKNYGYAFQWFAFALTLLIIFLRLGIKTHNDE